MRLGKPIAAELDSQRRQLKLIASENYASPAVLSPWGTGSPTSTPKAPRASLLRGMRGRRPASRRIATEHARRSSAPTTPTFSLTPGSTRTSSRSGRSSPTASSTVARRLGVAERQRSLGRALGGAPPRADDQRMLGMALMPAASHHGFRPNISGKLFEQRSYGVDPDDGAARLRRIRDAPVSSARSSSSPATRAYPRDTTSGGCARSPTRSTRRCCRHGALRRARGRQGVHRRPHPVRHAGRRDVHDPQVAAWPRGGWCSAPMRTGVRRSWLPVGARWPMPHVIAAKAVAFASRPAFGDAHHRANAALAEGWSDAARLVTEAPTTTSSPRRRRHLSTHRRQAKQHSSRRNSHEPQHDPATPTAWYTSGIRTDTCTHDLGMGPSSTRSPTSSPSSAQPGRAAGRTRHRASPLSNRRRRSRQITGARNRTAVPLPALPRGRTSGTVLGPARRPWIVRQGVERRLGPDFPRSSDP